MTAYFDDLNRWLTDLECAEAHSKPLRQRCFKHASKLWWEEQPDTIEARGWADYLLASVNHPDDEEDEPDPIQEIACRTIVCVIEAKVRRDLRFLEAALCAGDSKSQTSTAKRQAVRQAFARLWGKHPEPEQDGDDLATEAQRVRRLCSDAHDVMHALATAYEITDNPARAAEQTMDRANSKKRP